DRQLYRGAFMTRPAFTQSFRAALAASGLAALTLTPAGAQDADSRHGRPLMGDVKYPPDFKHFDYVNPDAPKDGELRIGAIGTFVSLNPFIIRSNAAALVGNIYDTLMQNALDEPSTEYGLLAESVSYPADYSSVTYT